MSQKTAEVESLDGLPVTQPTRSRVDAALAYTDLDPDHLVAEIPPGNGDATVEKIASNAVMAGCKPEYIPVVIAAVQAMTKEGSNLEGVMNTTHPGWPVLMVNGPIVNELEINYGFNALGQGFRANATIGRAITLILMNIGGTIPGRSDNATHGGPNKFGLCFAENQPANPWSPFHVEHGFDESTSIVTAIMSDAPHNIEDHASRTAADVLTTISHSMATLGTNLMYMSSRGEPFVIFGPEHAKVVADEGWDKQDVKRFIYDQARLPYHLMEGRGMHLERDGEFPWAQHFNVSDEHHRIGMCDSPERVKITVVGGPGRHSQFLPSWGDTNLQIEPITTADGTPVESVEEFR